MDVTAGGCTGAGADAKFCPTLRGRFSDGCPAVPPEAVTDAAPVAPPLHKIFVCDAADATSAVGCVIVIVALPGHPPASVIVTV